MKLTQKQIELVDAQVKRLIAGDSYYGKLYREKGITGVASQEDFEKLPFSSKDDLRNAYPLGIQAVPDEDVVRIHSSSGTTGRPVIIPYTKKDVDDWAIQFARCYEMAGTTKKDRIQITPGYGLRTLDSRNRIPGRLRKAWCHGSSNGTWKHGKTASDDAGPSVYSYLCNFKLCPFAFGRDHKARA